MRKRRLKLFDTVAILKDIPLQKVVYGQVGTIVEILDRSHFEVEFADKSGVTIAEFAVAAENLMLLHYQAVSV